MLTENKDVPVLSLLDQLKIQREQFVQQKEFSQNSLNQFVGAIHACDAMIKNYEQEMNREKTPDQENSETDSNEKEEAPQE